MLLVLDTNNGLLGLSILSICPTRRRPRESLVLVVVLVLVIGNGAIEDEDEKEDEDDWLAVPQRCAVSRSCTIEPGKQSISREILYTNPARWVSIQ